MAEPPVIPTSFVPHLGTSSGGVRRESFGFSTILSVLAYFFFLVALIATAGVFAYDRYLISEQATKDAALAKATAALDQTTIEQFLQLHNRLVAAKTLLDTHVALSGLFDLLESVTPNSVRFSSVNVTVDDLGTKLQAGGTAKNFNALASASTYFGTDARLKNAIFSNIAIGTGATVSFQLSATLDPKLITYTGAAVASSVGQTSASQAGVIAPQAVTPAVVTPPATKSTVASSTPPVPSHP